MGGILRENVGLYCLESPDKIEGSWLLYFAFCSGQGLDRRQ